MLSVKIGLTGSLCHKCGKPLENNTPIVHINRKFNENYCRECGLVKDDMTENGKSGNEFALYYHENGVGKLIVDNDNLEYIPYGLHELKLVKMGEKSIYVVQSSLIFTEKKESVADFLGRIDSKNVILEKRLSRCALFYPRNRIICDGDFLGKINEVSSFYKSFTRQFTMMTRSHRYGYICTADRKIIGVVSNTDSETSEQFASYIAPFSVKSVVDIEAEYEKSVTSRRIRSAMETLTPAAMLEYCERRIMGQGTELKKAVYKVYSYMQAVASGAPFRAENWLLTSPSGTGKTEFYRTIRDLFRLYNIPIPVVQIDLSQITESGFKGDNVNTIPKKILSEDKKSTGVAICFLDEADKKCLPSYSQGVNINAAIQSNLLTLIEGMEMKIDIDGDDMEFDSGKTMFVFLGSFQELRDKKQQRTAIAPKIGFLTENDASDTVADGDPFHEGLTVQDIVSFGMQEELAGRITSIINFRRLSEKDMLTLIRSKVSDLAREMGCSIILKKCAEEDILKISFGNLGLRQPLNAIKTLVENTIANVFFDRGFDKTEDKIIIYSLNLARIERSRQRNV